MGGGGGGKGRRGGGVKGCRSDNRSVNLMLLPRQDPARESVSVRFR